jgi:heptosyltransferase II
VKVMNGRLVKVARHLDILWGALGRMFLRSRCSTPVTDVKSILIVDLHLVGDIVMLIPLLQAVRRRYAFAKITLIAGPWAVPILMGANLVDELIPFTAPWVKKTQWMRAVSDCLALIGNLRKRKWDIGVDVRGDIRQIIILALSGSQRRIGFDFTGGAALLTDVVPDDGIIHHILDHHQRIARAMDAWNEDKFLPRIWLTSDESLAVANEPSFIGFHFGASLSLRRLPPSEAAMLIRIFERDVRQLVLFSAPDLEEYIIAVIRLIPVELADRIQIWKGDLREMCVKISSASLMITMDSGPGHIAAALERETVVVFGPNLPKYTGPQGENVRFLEDADVLCRPCDQHSCSNPVFQACMLGLVKKFDQTMAPDLLRTASNIGGEE